MNYNVTIVHALNILDVREKKKKKKKEKKNGLWNSWIRIYLSKWNDLLS